MVGGSRAADIRQLAPRSSAPRSRDFKAVVAGLVCTLGLTVTGGPATAAESSDTTTCGANVTPAPVTTKQINLVIDDSGSMFSNGKTALDRWSFAKYSLEVFAALMGPEDSLAVYRMSDFDGTSSAGPAVSLTGGLGNVAANVAAIHQMPLAGGGTPYSTVKRASQDLKNSSADEKWLVILTDGEFDDRATPQVVSDLKQWVSDNSQGNRPFKVAFMGLGDKAASIPDDPDAGIFFVRAEDTLDLLNQMTGFANRIFARALAQKTSATEWSPDIALEEAVVFAQGPDVTVGTMRASGVDIEPSSVVRVSWADNPRVEWGNRQVPAVPNTDLEGTLATYESIPKGDLSLDVANATTVDIIYKPKVDFGVKLLDSNGDEVTGDKVIGGTYTIEYGFMDEDCVIVQSNLIGDVTYTATIYSDGAVVADGIASGTQVDLPRGEYTMAVSATYLGGNTSSAEVALTVLQPAAPVAMEVSPGTYNASEMGDLPPLDEGIALTYYQVNEATGEKSPLSAEAWTALNVDDFTVTSDSNVEFTIVKGGQSGQMTLLPKAPGGDVYAVDTGAFEVTVTGSSTYDGQTSQASVTGPIDIVDDISALDRWKHWLATTGWKLLLLLLALILAAGYLFKKRFAKRIKRRPSIVGTPRQIGVGSEESFGKFRKNAVRKWLPFVADTATLTYVPPGVFGFRPMKLKAGPRKSMTLVNWKQIAEKDNTEINGTPLGEDTSRAPSFGASAQITANTPQMTYELTPND